MTDSRQGVSNATVVLPEAAYQKMLALIRILDDLSANESYRGEVYPVLPAVARLDPGHASAMMCYDFHLDGDVPRLIEVNTNAGGGLLACMACDPGLSAEDPVIPDELKADLLQMFADEMKSFTSGSTEKPTRIAIIDDDPPGQNLYPEMRVFAKLFLEWGTDVVILEPGDLEAGRDGVFHKGQPVDMIYNRHCDFYLESDGVAGINEAYQNRSVCLTPNPHMYGLLADKRRMALWRDSERVDRWGLGEADVVLLNRIVPGVSLLAELDPRSLWQGRKGYAFKPVDSFGSRGVLLGGKTTRKRFEQLPQQTTLAQELVPPSMTDVPGYGPMKTDFRVFAYRDRPLGVTARLYRGQVTNLRTPGGGFARVDIV